MNRKLKSDSNITSLSKLLEAIKLMWVRDTHIPHF
jgi:hypothetical protein